MSSAVIGFSYYLISDVAIALFLIWLLGQVLIDVEDMYSFFISYIFLHSDIVCHGFCIRQILHLVGYVCVVGVLTFACCIFARV